LTWTSNALATSHSA